MARKRRVFVNYLYIFAFLPVLPAHGDQRIETRVHDLIIASDPGEATRVLSTSDGRVYDIDSRQAD